MSEILRPKLRNLFNTFSSQKQGIVASFGTPVQKKKDIEEKQRLSTPRGRYEDPSSRPGLPNYTAEYATNAEIFSTPIRGATRDTKKIWGSPSPKLIKAKFLPEKSQQHYNMNTLVLDMDETLLHASTVPAVKPDFIVRLSDGARFYVLKRPNVEEFLERMSKLYEIVIYTSGEKEYATALINHIDPNGYISHILHREHCITTRNGLDKDLSYIGRDLNTVVFIDNLEENLRRQKDNGIRILDFYANKRDDELRKLVPFLEYAANLSEVRPINRIYSDFLVRGLQQPDNAKFKQKLESTQSHKDFPERRGSLFGDQIHKKSKFAKLNDSSAGVDKENKEHFSTPDPIKVHEKPNEVGLPSTQFLLSQRTGSKSLFFVTRSDEKAHLLKGERPAYNHGDLGSPKNVMGGLDGEKSKSNQSYSEPKSWETFMRYEEEKRVAIEKQTITLTREKETGVLIESAVDNIQKEKMLNTTEKSPLLGELYEKINALEQRLKSAKSLSKL